MFAGCTVCIAHAFIYFSIITESNSTSDWQWMFTTQMWQKAIRRRRAISMWACASVHRPYNNIHSEHRGRLHVCVCVCCWRARQKATKKQRRKNWKGQKYYNVNNGCDCCLCHVTSAKFLFLHFPYGPCTDTIYQTHTHTHIQRSAQAVHHRSECDGKNASGSRKCAFYRVNVLPAFSLCTWKIH